MASDLDFVQFVTEQMEAAGTIIYRKMFGEYGIYCNGTIFGLICDNKLFIKQTEKGNEFIGTVVEAPPYPGARNYYYIEDKFENREWISELVIITIKNLPKPTKNKRAKAIIKKSRK